MDEFMSSPLVAWVTGLNTDNINENKATLDLLTDGVFLSDLLLKIDAAAFAGMKVQRSVIGDVSARTQNLIEVLQSVKSFYQDKLQLLLVMKLPNVLGIAKDPESAQSLHDLQKILLLILGCAVQCDGKEYFIDNIKELDVSVQQGLVIYIKEITENPDYVISCRINDVTDCSHDELFGLSESMFYQVQRLLQERDEYSEMLLDMHLEKHLGTPCDQNSIHNLRSSPPLSPGGNFKASVYQKNKAKLRDTQMELEDKNMVLAEAKEEISGLKTTVEALKQENKQLMGDARWATTYRDELDILKAQVGKVNKLESENMKFKEKMRELDFYKKRFEELKEQHELLYETKLVLEEQVQGSKALAEKAGSFEQENNRLRKQVELLSEENESKQDQIQTLIDDINKLSNDNESSFCEVSSLNAELDGLRSQSSNLPSVPLSMEWKESSSTELLRYEKENRHLTKLVETLKQQSPKLKELEKQNSVLENMLKDHKNTIMKMTEELMFDKKRAGELSAIVERNVDKIESLSSILDSKSKQMKDVCKELERKGIDLDVLQGSLTTENGRLEVTSRSPTPTLKEIHSIKLELEAKEEALKLCKSRLDEAETAGKNLGTELGQKKEHVGRLEERVKEYESYGEKVEEQLAQREKDIVDLERRFESTLTENKTLNQTIFLKDDKIAALEGRISHFMDSASQDTKKVNEALDKRFKETQELELRLLKQQEQLQDKTKLETDVAHKAEKIDNLIRDISGKEKLKQSLEIELEKALACASQAEHSSKLKTERIKSLEASIEEIRTQSASQLEFKVTSLTEALQHKADALMDSESRIDEIVSLNNKLKTAANLKNERIQTLEDLITDMEGKGDQTRDEKLERLNKKLQGKEEHLATLENRLEDCSGKLLKQGKTIEMKDEKINELELRLQELEEVQRHSKVLTRQLQEKTTRLTEMDTINSDLQTSCQHFESRLSQKEQKYNQAQKSLLELENALSDHGSMTKLVQLKDDKINLLQGSLLEKEKRIVELETKSEEFDISTDKLNYSLKMKERKINELEIRLDSFDGIEAQISKMRALLEQRDAKIKQMEDELDDTNELQRLNSRLKGSVTQKEDKIISLEQRLHDLDEAVNINTRLNNQVEVKDKTISTQQRRIHDLEDALKKVEHTRDSIKHNSEDEILALRSRIDELTDGKAKRQDSIRRREHKITTLETKLEEIESTTQKKESKIQQLQSRLQGTKTKFQSLDESREGKDEQIKELETRIMELSTTYKENTLLSGKLEFTTQEAEENKKKAQKSEEICTRQQETIAEFNSNVASLQERLDEVLALNSRLDTTSKNQEEKLQHLEESLQCQTDECDLLLTERQNSKKTIQRLKNKITELEETIAATEKEMDALRSSHHTVDQARKAALHKSNQQLTQKDDIIDDLERKVESSPSVSRQEVVVIPISKERDERQQLMQAKVNTLTDENHKLKLEMEEKQNRLADFERKIEETHAASSTNSNRLNTILKEKTNQIGLLRAEVDSSKEELAKIETRCMDLSSVASRTENALTQKDARIQSIKEQLEESRNKSHALVNDTELCREKILSLEKSLDDASEKYRQLDEDYSALQYDHNALKGKSEKSSVENVVERIQLTKRARTELHISRAAPRLHHIVRVSDLSANQTDKDERLTSMQEQCDLHVKEKSRIALQNRSLASENASIQTENESLRSELELLRSDYGTMKRDMVEAKEHYKELDFSATKIVHRCEVLVQLNTTLEEENSALMDQINKLLAQNQELLMKSLQSKDDMMEEERMFSDKLYMLERQKQQLMDQVHMTNRTLADTSNNKQKKSGFWRGANKVLKKAGLKKKREDDAGVSLVRMQPTGDGESFSDGGGSASSLSPRYRSDGSSTLSPVEMYAEPVVMRRHTEMVQQRPATYYGSPSDMSRSPMLDSQSNSSDRSSGRFPPTRARPVSEFRAEQYGSDSSTPMRKLHRPKSMEMLDSFKADNDAFLSDMRARHLDENEDKMDGNIRLDDDHERMRSMSSASYHSSVSENSVRSQSSSASGPQFVRSYARDGNKDGRLRTSGSSASSHSRASVQKVRVTEKVIPSSPQIHRAKDELKMIAEYLQDAPRKVSLPHESSTNNESAFSSSSDSRRDFDPVHVNIRDGKCSVIDEDRSQSRALASHDYTEVLPMEEYRPGSDAQGLFYMPSPIRSRASSASSSGYRMNSERQAPRQASNSAIPYSIGSDTDVDLASGPNLSDVAHGEEEQMYDHGGNSDGQQQHQQSSSSAVTVVSDSEEGFERQRQQRGESEPKKIPVWYEYGCV